MKQERILIVEDDESIREVLAMTLVAEGYESPLSAADGNEALVLARRHLPDLILLDLMLPGVDGFTVCETLKADRELRRIPVIMLTARGSEADIVRGLDLGAGDYITKPFNRQVLLARIRTQLRLREESGERPSHEYGPLRLDPQKHQATLDGEELDLTAGEMTLLHLFLNHPGQVFTRSQIVARTKGGNYPVTERAIDVQMVSLRRKLKSLSPALETVRGVGYRLKPAETP